MNKYLAAACGVMAFAVSSQAQVLLSGGLSYSQNFDSLTTPSGSSVTWNNNSTLMGWYGNRAATASSGPVGSYAYGSYNYESGTANNGWIKSYGVDGVNSINDRAFGSVGSGTPKTNAIALRIKNDTTDPWKLASLSFTGEQWRVGQGSTSMTQNRLYFSYKTGVLVDDPVPNDANPSDPGSWTFDTRFWFNGPIMPASTSAAGIALDGNALANRIGFSDTFTGVTLQPGDEIMLRWTDPDEPGNDMGLAIDDLTVTFAAVPEPTTALLGLLAAGLLVLRRRS